MWIGIRARPLTETDTGQLRDELATPQRRGCPFGQPEGSLGEQVRLMRNKQAGHVSRMVRFSADDAELTMINENLTALGTLGKVITACCRQNMLRAPS